MIFDGSNLGKVGHGNVLDFETKPRWLRSSVEQLLPSVKGTILDLFWINLRQNFLDEFIVIPVSAHYKMFSDPSPVNLLAETPVLFDSVKVWAVRCIVTPLELDFCLVVVSHEVFESLLAAMESGVIQIQCDLGVFSLL